jgi:hypothetical protein
VKIEMRDPGERALRLHPVRKQITLDSTCDKDRWNAFVDGLSGAGPKGIPPITITADGRVMDGDRRWRAAKQLGWKEIACVVRPEEEAAVLIVESLIGQRDLAPGTKVYLALTILPEFVQSFEFRRLQNLKNGVKTLEKPLTTKLSDEKSSRSLAEKFGVSRETMRRVIAVRDLFAKSPDLKVEWEPKLLAGEKNLWNVLSAVGGAGADQSKRADGVEQGTFDFWTAAFTPLTERASTWNRLAADTRQKITEQWAQAAKAMPKELRKAIVEVLENA